jgi:hypothetical protein
LVSTGAMVVSEVISFTGVSIALFPQAESEIKEPNKATEAIFIILKFFIILNQN